MTHPASPSSDADLYAARLAAIVSSSDDAIVSKTLDGVITSWNAAATRILGYQPEEIIGQHITRIIPEELQAEEAAIIASLRRGERIEHFDTVRQRKDGTRVHLSITVSPIRDSSGRIVGASKVARDITERKEHEEAQQILFDELNHRVKNTLATVQALAMQSLRGDQDLKMAREVFMGRLMALSAAHDHLSRNAWQNASLDAVVAQTLRPYGVRISCDGPALQLSPKQTVCWGMIVHELATNAVKYGALSHAGGHVRAHWRVSADDVVEFDWAESGGRPVSQPSRKGFGTVFVERSAAVELKGSARFDYRPEGLQVHIRAAVRE